MKCPSCESEMTVEQFRIIDVTVDGGGFKSAIDLVGECGCGCRINAFVSESDFMEL